MHDVKIAVVIPSYKVRAHILDVIDGIGTEVKKIYVIDDCCPDLSGNYVEENCLDPRVSVVRHQENQGVGGAVMTGYQWAIRDEMDIVVKVDGDGQMDPKLIPAFVSPIVAGQADYTKGNRFYDLEKIGRMPRFRLIGNAALSFMTKISSGYWDSFDPTNGFTAMHVEVAKHLPLNKISKRYFFETDVLFRLGTLRAVVVDIPMDAKYEDEISNLKIHKVVGEFAFKHARNFVKRVFYNYYLRDMSLASVELPLGLVLFVSGSVYGAMKWIGSFQTGEPSTSGEVMLAALPVILGTQFLLAFIGYDIYSTPKRTFHSKKYLAR